jgi:hypothetical protein
MSGMDDWGWDEAATTDTKPAGGVLEAGRHVAQISAAKWERKERIPEKWLSKNPEGWRVVLSLTVHSQGRKYQLFADVPRHWRWLFEVICDATGTELPRDASWQPSEWIGRDVEIETTVWESNSGPRAQVEKWFPHEAAPAPKPAAKPARTPAAKVAAARGDEPGGEDDIPFIWIVPFLLSAVSCTWGA